MYWLTEAAHWSVGKCIFSGQLPNICTSVKRVETVVWFTLTALSSWAGGFRSEVDSARVAEHFVGSALKLSRSL